MFNVMQCNTIFVLYSVSSQTHFILHNTLKQHQADEKTNSARWVNNKDRVNNKGQHIGVKMS